jgi:ATP-binding cassette, subfamily B, multidrug efflux pump
MRELAYLNRYFFAYKKYLFLGILFTVLSNIFGLIPAQLVRESLDMVVIKVKEYQAIGYPTLKLQYFDSVAWTAFKYGAIIFGLALVKGFFLFLVRQTLIVMSRHIEYDLKNEIYLHYQTLPLAFFRKNNTGDLMARISEDVNKVRMYIGPSIMYGLNLLVVFVLVIGYMLSINVKLTLFVLLPLPVLSFSIFYVNKLIIKRSERIQAQLSEISTFVQEAFSGIRVLKAFAKEGISESKFKLEADIYRKRSLHLVTIDSLFSPLIQLLIGISTVLVVYVGGNLVMDGKLSIGHITEFIMYVYMLTWPVTALGWTTSQIQRAAASQKRINEFLQTTSNIVSEENLKPAIEGTIEFKNVGLTYADTGIKALQNINFSIEAGQTLAVLGSTGSGKSTLANLICRMYDPTQGQILLDKKPLNAYNVGYLRANMGYVPQEVFLFSDSILNNITFGDTSISEDSAINAAKNADLYNNVMEFPEQFQVQLGERGITLSGGQKQRLSIARAIVRNPKIVVLDDCLSAVDTHTEHTILNNLAQVMQGRTNIIISHRVSSAKLADKILFLDQGTVVEEGSHQKLMDKKGMYYELYQKQLVEQ